MHFFLNALLFWSQVVLTWFCCPYHQTNIEKLRCCTEQDSCDCKNMQRVGALPWSNRFSRTFKQLHVARGPKVLPTALFSCIRKDRNSCLVDIETYQFESTNGSWVVWRGAHGVHWVWINSKRCRRISHKCLLTFNINAMCTTKINIVQHALKFCTLQPMYNTLCIM